MSARLVRPALALVAVAAVMASGVAQAAPAKGKKPAPPVCNLIEDTKSDTFLVRSQDSQKAYGPQEDALDLVSEDVASDGVTLTAVVRVVKLATRVGSAPGGTDYRVQFTIPGQDGTKENFVLNARTDSSGAPSFLLALRTIVGASQSVSQKVADATGAFDLAKNEVHISVPVASVKSGSNVLGKDGLLLFSGLDQTSSRSTFVNPATGTATATFADVTATEKSYKVGTPSCVVPGK